MNNAITRKGWSADWRIVDGYNGPVIMSRSQGVIIASGSKAASLISRRGW